jgi:hypothetical protein
MKRMIAHGDGTAGAPGAAGTRKTDAGTGVFIEFATIVGSHVSRTCPYSTSDPGLSQQFFGRATRRRTSPAVINPASSTSIARDDAA